MFLPNRKIISICIVLAAVFVVQYSPSCACVQVAENRITEFLSKIAHATDSLSFEAVTVFEYYLPDSTYRYKQRSVITPNESWWQFTEPLSRSKRIYIQKGDKLFTKNLLTDSASVNIQPRKGKYIDPNNLYIDPNNRVLLLKNYTITFLQEEKLFDSVAEVVKITPVHKDRGWIQLWVDKKNGFIYRYELYDSDNKKRYVEYKEKIQFNPRIDPTLFEYKASFIKEISSSPQPKLYNNISDVLADVNFTVMIPNFLPPGYSLNQISVSQQKFRDNTVNPYLHLSYTDGLSSFSVFMHFATKKNKEDYKTPKIFENHDSGKIWANVVGVIDNTYVYIVGDLPIITIKKMYDNIGKFQKCNF